MRLFIPEELLKIEDIIAPYMIYTKEEGYHLSPGSPQEIFDLHRKYCEEMDKLEEEWRRANW